MTEIDLYNLLLVKFPLSNMYKIEGAQPIIIRVYALREKTAMGTTTHYLGKQRREQLMDYLNGLGIPTTYEIIEDEVDEPPKIGATLAHNPVHFLYANKLWNKEIGEFSERDEALWFDNIDDIFAGTFRKDDLYFFQRDNYACYLDYTDAEHIDIRNLLLLYRTIYLTPPYEKDIRNWLANQRITENEYLELVSKGRIKVILTQPEFRYQMGFFRDMYNIAPDSVITRRAIAALQQIDIVEMSDNYVIKDPAIFREVKKFSDAAGLKLGFDPTAYYEMLTWPVKARRDSFDFLNQKGGFGTAAYGVNNFVNKFIQQRTGKDYNFEFTITSANIHLAHALNATYYPYKSTHSFSDAFYTHMMGIYLNMFKLATSETLSLLSKTNGDQPLKQLILDPIEIIDVNTYIPILEFEAILEDSQAYLGGKRLMETLAALTPEARQAKIGTYNQLVQKEINRKKSSDFKIDLATNVALDGVGLITGAPGLGTAFATLKKGGQTLVKKIKQSRNANGSAADMDEDDIDKANIHFLTKINRVAGLKRF